MPSGGRANETLSYRRLSLDRVLRRVERVRISRPGLARWLDRDADAARIVVRNTARWIDELGPVGGRGAGNVEQLPQSRTVPRRSRLHRGDRRQQRLQQRLFL